MRTPQQRRASKRRYYEKYRDLCAKRGVGYSGGDFMGHDPEYWKAKYAEDEYLNNHPLSHFDSVVGGYAPLGVYRGLSLAEGVCMLKHVITYHIVGAPVPPEG